MESLPPTRMSGKQTHENTHGDFSLCVYCFQKYVIIVIKIMESTLFCPLPISLYTGHLGLCCGRLPLWQNSPTKVSLMNKFSVLSWRGGFWRNLRTVPICCKTHKLHTAHSHKMLSCLFSSSLLVNFNYPLSEGELLPFSLWSLDLLNCSTDCLHSPSIFQCVNLCSLRCVSS